MIKDRIWFFKNKTEIMEKNYPIFNNEIEQYLLKLSWRTVISFTNTTIKSVIKHRRH